MPRYAKLFILCEFVVALCVIAFSLANWSWSGAIPFLVLLGLSTATGAMKVVLPSVPGSLSLSYVFLMLGIVRMSMGETLLLGWAASLVQSYWRYKKKPTAIQLVFNLSAISISIAAGSLVFHAGFLQALTPSPLPRIFLAAFAYFLANTLSVAAVIGTTECLSIWEVWRSSYLWSFPHYALSASLVGVIEYFKQALGLEFAILVLPAAYLVYRAFTMHIGSLSQALDRSEQDKRHAEETANLHLRTIRALALAIEAKDTTTGEHLHRVQTYAMELAKDFGLKGEEVDALRAASILHDVGKLAVPEHIISKPGKLTPDEFAKMKIHTVVGAEIVASVHFPFSVAPLVRSHHEKWNGMGYPDGLKGEEIPIGARILSAVDCFDALASDRQYRKAMPLDKAMAIVVSESGKAFDPKVVERFQARYLELESLAQSTLKDDPLKLSIDAVVERGFAPDAGYAAGSTGPGKDYALAQGEAIREAAILNAINSQFGKAESIDGDLAAAADQLGQLVPHDCIALYRQLGKNLECVFAQGEAAPVLSGLKIESGVGLSGWTLANRTPLLNGNAATEFGVVGKTPAAFDLSSGLSIPLESEFGTIGALTVYSKKRDAFQTSHIRALLAIGSRLAYQMFIDSSGVARAGRSAAEQADQSIGLQLGRLSEVVRENAPPPASAAQNLIAGEKDSGSTHT
jgi:putative nucleotidyltransferase with HDIG domain